MKKHAYFICFICLVILFVAVYFGGYFYTLNFQKTDTYTENENTDLEISTVSLEKGFWLGVEDDCVVIYYADKKTVYFNTRIRTEELSDDELALVESGIYFEDISVILKYLESYTS